MSLDFIARCPECRRVVAAFCYSRERLPEIARETGKWIRWGLDVQRMETEEVRKAEWCHATDCSLTPVKRKRSAVKS